MYVLKKHVGKNGAIAVNSIWHKFFNDVTNYFMAKANRSSSSHNSGKKGTKRKTTRDVVKRHLSNKHDKITDDDFKNLSLEHPNEKTDQTLPIKEGKERPKDVEKDNTITTPWDVINE